MSQSTVIYYGKGCSGCTFNVKVAELKGGCNKTYHHVCTKKNKLLNKDMRINLTTKYSCFVGR